MGADAVTIGVLALQGAFHEHQARFASLNASHAGPSVRAIAVRTAEQLASCDGLVLPGGESTSIAMGLRQASLFEPLRDWIRAGRPVWGTCAGMIMLATVATGGKRGGQELVGGMDVVVGRNGFGSQVFSFECELDVPALGGEPFPGVFIRAPVVEQLQPAGTSSDAMAAVAQRCVEAGLTVATAPPDMHHLWPDVRVEPLAWLPRDCEALPRVDAHAPLPDCYIVAYRQGALLATSFHPELTPDARLHQYFVQIVLDSRRSAGDTQRV